MRLRDRHHAHQLEWQSFEFQIRVTSTKSMYLKYTTYVFKIHDHMYLIYTAKRGIFKSNLRVINFYGLMMLPRIGSKLHTSYSELGKMNSIMQREKDR